MIRKHRGHASRTEGGVSSVLGAILIFAILSIAALQYQFEWRPVLSKAAEASHSSVVESQLAAIKAELDRQVANPSAAPIAHPLSLRSGGGYLGSSSTDRLSIDSGAASFAASSPQMTVQLSEGEFAGIANESWQTVSATGVLVEDVGRIQSLRLRLLQVSSANDTQFLTITARDANGHAGSFRVTVTNPNGQDWRINYWIRNRQNVTLYDNPDSFQNSVGPFPYYWVDLLEDRYRFEQVLLATTGPLTLTLTKSGLGGEFTITYQNAVTGAVSGGGGTTFSPYSLPEIKSATIRYTAQHNELPQQTYVLENGGLILEQPDGAAFKIKPGFVLSSQPATGTRVTVSMPSGILQSDLLIAHVVARGGAAITITAPAGWTTVSRVNTPLGELASAVFSRVATGSESGAVSFTFNSRTSAVAELLTYRGASSLDATVRSGQANAESSSITAPGVTTPQPNDRVVGLFALANSSPIAMPSGMTLRAQAESAGGAGVSAAAGDYLQTVSGPTGNKVASAGQSGVSIGHLLLIHPSAIAVRTNVGQAVLNTAATQITIPRPSDAVTGDVLVAQIVVRGTGTEITPPAGWTEVRASATQTNIRLATYYRISTGTNTAHTFTFSSSQRAIGAMVAFGNVDTESVTGGSTSASGSSATATAAGFTPARANSLLLAIFGAGVGASGTGGYFSAPTGMTERFDIRTTVGSDAAGSMNTQVLGAAAATGTRQSTLVASNPWIAWLVALNQGASFRSVSTYSTDSAGATRLSVSLPVLSGLPGSITGARSLTLQTSATRVADFVASAGEYTVQIKTDYPELWTRFWREEAAAIDLVEGAGFRVTSAGDTVSFQLLGTTAASTAEDIIIVYKQSLVTVQLEG